jgi:hypothetical protein
MYQNKNIVIDYKKTSAIKERTISLNEKPLELFEDEELNALVADIPYRVLKSDNQIQILDPPSMDHKRG